MSINNICQVLKEENYKDINKLINFIEENIKDYEKILNLNKEEILNSLENYRSIPASIYYTENNFPKVKDLNIFHDFKEMEKKIDFSKGFICPGCKEKSVNPYKCTPVDKEKKSCNFRKKSLNNTDNFFKFTFRDDFLSMPVIDQIFFPVDI